MSDLTGGKAQCQLDLFVKRWGIETSRKHNWKVMCIIEELKWLKWTLKKILLQLTRYMCDAFITQPICCFIHGFFLLHSTTMELWVFDHSGPYSSGKSDIHKEHEKFIWAITGYTMMDDEGLGLDTSTELNDTDWFIIISEDVTWKKNKMQLNEVSFCQATCGCVCQDTTCFHSSDWENVVKILWTSDKRPPKADHLWLACEKGVEGIPSSSGISVLPASVSFAAD